MAETVVTDQPTKRRVNRIVAGIALALIVAVAAAFMFASNFVEDEYQRDVRAWQIRLNIVADSRAAAVNGWVDGNFANMRELSENASLQLYLTELVLGEGAAANADERLAESEYLRNLLIATANRAGYTAPTGDEVAANVERVGIAGIGLVDQTGKPIISTPGMPPISPEIRKAVAKALGGEPALVDMYLGAGNQPTMGFVLPVFAVQGGQTGGIGAVVGIRTVDKDLYTHLKQPGDASQTSETYLVRKSGPSVEFISPLANATPPLKQKLSREDENLSAAYALKEPGGFAIKMDYASTKVLTVSRQLSIVPWVLVRKISYGEALSKTESRVKSIFTVLVLIIVAVSVTLIAVWRHGTSLRAAQAVENYRQSSERFESLSRFMRIVTDSQPTQISAVNQDGFYTFANRRAASEAGISPEDIKDKTMASVIGPVRAKVFGELNREALARAEPQSSIHHFNDEAGDRVIKSDHVPLTGDSEHQNGVLMVLDDITELTQEKELSEERLRQLINTLVSIIDRRDPFSAHHSTRAAEVARGITLEMELSNLDTKTVDIAGSLMNLGKIYIPQNLLTKTGDLTEDERAQLSNSYAISAELLESVNFEGPAVETIRQFTESWDGTGPLGLTGEEILPTARVLAVANAFVGMVSPRAYREALTFENVSDIMLDQSGTKYDRKAVSALINILENRGGKERWNHFRDRPPEAG